MADSSPQTSLPESVDYFIARLRELHNQMRTHMVAQLRQEKLEALSDVATARGGDTIYEIDERVEAVLFEYCEAWGQELPFILIAEGVPGTGERVFPDGTPL